MCGRFALSLPQDALVNIFQAKPFNSLPELPNYNICPTTSIHTITSENKSRIIKPMRWGFIPKWYETMNDGPLLINARSETIAKNQHLKMHVDIGAV